MSEKIIVLHPENQPEVDIYPIIKEGSIPNSVIDNQKIKRNSFRDCLLLIGRRNMYTNIRYIIQTIYLKKIL